MSRILCIGDTHFPFIDRRKLDRLYSIASRLNPTHIVQVGDCFDFYSFSKFSRSLNYITPREEIKQGRAMALEMWTRLDSLFPDARKYQMRGNHCDRLYKLLMDKAPAYESILEEPMKKLFLFPHVQTMKTSRDELVIGDTVFNHGWLPRIGDHARYYLKNTVVGHTHRGGLIYIPRKGSPLFELNAGFLGDPDALPMDYNPTHTKSWIPGFGTIDEDGPRFYADKD